MASGDSLETGASTKTVEPEEIARARPFNAEGAPGRPTSSPADPPTLPKEASEVERLQELLSGQGEILEFMCGGAEFDRVLERIALLVERIARPARCSIHLLDSTGTSLCRGAAPSLPDDYLRTIDDPDIGTEASPCHAAAERRESIALADLADEAPWPAFRERALANGLRALCALPILDRQGQLLGVLALHHQDPHPADPADHRLMEAVASLAGFAIKHDLRERSRRFVDARFTSLASTIPGVVYQRLVTPDGDIRYTYISEGAKDLFGVSPEEILADPQALFDCHGPEYRATFRERLLEASRKLEMWDVEAQIITRDGAEKWTHAIARPHRLTDGSVLWDGIILDNTWIKKVEFELRDAKEAAETTSRAYTRLLIKLRSANERFASLAASIPGVVYQRLVTPDGDIRYTYISEGAKDLFGVSPEEILADPQALFDCHGPEYRATFRERLLEASRKLEMWDVEAQIITRDGAEKWTHAIARPHRLPDGSVLWDGVILDNTWIKKAEFELRKAKEAAEASSTAKTEFLAQMSHELRTPLNAIIGFSEILQTQCFGSLGDEKYMDYANHINASGVHLLETINDILEFTRLETGDIRLFESKVDISAALDIAVKQMTPVAEMMHVNITGPLDDGLPMVYGDEAKIRKIVTNLLSNAIKFTPQNGYVNVAARTNDAGDLVITVSDTGIGIPAEHIAKIFEAFRQIDSDLDRKFEGLGLGIPLSVKLAKLHDAHLTFESEVGVGTTVAFVLPAARVLDRPDETASASRHRPAPGSDRVGTV